MELYLVLAELILAHFHQNRAHSVKMPQFGTDVVWTLVITLRYRTT